MAVRFTILLACRFPRRRFVPPCPPQPFFERPSGTLLRTRLTPGEPLFLQINIDTVQKMSVMQMDVGQKQRQMFVVRFLPGKKEGGLLPVRMTIIGVKMDLDIGTSAACGRS